MCRTMPLRLLLLLLPAMVACRTRLAGNLDGFVCDTATGICTPKGDGAAPDGSADADGSSDVGEVGGGNPDADGGGGGNGDDGSTDGVAGDGPDATGSGNIFISSPTGTVYTNGTVAIQVGFGPGSSVPATIDILSSASATPLATIGPNFNFMWDTTNVPEGSYQVTARASFGGQPASSAPITVIVDRTAPTITSRTPLPDATNVDLTLPIVVTVSEPLAPATVSASGVTLTIGGSTVPSKTVLSADGKTLTTTLTKRQAVALPATFQQVLPATITDLAGNALSTTPWTWMAPLWLQFGSVQGEAPDVALDSKGNILVSAAAERGALGSRDYQVVVARHKSGTSWDTSFGSPQGAQGSSFVNGAGALLAASDDNPIVAWPEFEGANTGNPTDIHVAKWTGTAWDTSFGAISGEQGAGSNAMGPRLARGPADQFLLAWTESSQMYVNSVYAARWTGTSWDQSYGGVAKIGATLSTLKGTATGQPQVTWNSSIDGGGLSSWTGSAWATKTFANAIIGGLAFDSMQMPLFATMDANAQTITVVKADNGTSVAPPVATAMNPGGARLVVDGSGQVLVAWSDSDGTTRNVHVARYDGTSWDTSFGTISALSGSDTPASNPALVITSDGVPVLAWQELPSGTGTRPQTFVWKSNH